jgi:acyl-CoA dehydrogenase
MNVPGLNWFFKLLGFWSHLNPLSSGPSDQLTHKLSALIQEDSPQRDRMTDGLFISGDLQDPLRQADEAFKLVKAAEPIEKKLMKAVRKKELPRLKGPALVAAALEKGLLNEIEVATLKKAHAMSYEAISVDDFSQSEYKNHTVTPLKSTLASSL